MPITSKFTQEFDINKQLGVVVFFVIWDSAVKAELEGHSVTPGPVSYLWNICLASD